VRKSNGNLAANGTLYWYMTPGVVAESDLAGTTKSEYIFFDGERVARRDGATGTGGVFYYFSDHLKTASVITDSAGVIKAESDYYPWGGELQFVNNDTNDYKFTGKKRDTETGLDYFGARYYSNGLGRWVSADWSEAPDPIPYAHFDDPQTLNLYGYVGGNPASKTDLDGHGFFRKLWNGVVYSHFVEDDELKTIQEKEAQQARLAKDLWQKTHPGQSYEQHKLQMLLRQLDFTPMAGLAIEGEALQGISKLAGSAKGAQTAIRIVEQEGSVVHLIIKGAKGDIEVMADMSKEGDKLILRNAHVQGQGAGSSSLSELKAAARELGKQQGVKEVVVEGASRTSGANVGKAPIPITIKVGQ
jgi:RHS repeat-associated protein